jgi:hypothetical protein
VGSRSLLQAIVERHLAVQGDSKGKSGQSGDGKRGNKTPHVGIKDVVFVSPKQDTKMQQ